MDLETIYSFLPVSFQNLVCTLQGFRINRRRYGKGYNGTYEACLSRLAMPADALRALQGNRMRQHMIIARQTPFWDTRFRDYAIDLDRDDIWSQYSALPILTKQEVHTHREQIINKTLPYRQLITRHTSGTTGSGLVFPVTIEAEHEQWATWWRYRHTHGITRHEWCGYFGGRSIVPISQKKPPFWRINKAAKQILFSTYHLSDKTAPTYLHALQQYRPAWLHGYPSALSLLAGAIRSIAPSFTSWIRVVTTGAESLLDHQRQVIAAVFNCPVRQHYGLAEGTSSISECPSGNLHVDEDFAYTDFVPHQTHAHLHRIVGTNWTNVAFPLIRYDSGDHVVLERRDCDCGHPGRLVKSIDGRQEDYILLPSGARLGRLDHIFKDMQLIAEAQITQRASGPVTFRIVRRSGYNADTEKHLIAESRKRMGSDIVITVEYVTSLPRTSSGKLRFVSRLPD